MSKYETIGGRPSRAVTFSKVLDLLDQLRDQVLVLAHLDADDDKLRAQGFFAIAEMLKLTRDNIIKIAKGSLQ